MPTALNGISQIDKQTLRRRRSLGGLKKERERKKLSNVRTVNTLISIGGEKTSCGYLGKKMETRWYDQIEQAQEQQH